jgi:predicted heme/steroid binding protein
MRKPLTAALPVLLLGTALTLAACGPGTAESTESTAPEDGIATATSSGAGTAETAAPPNQVASSWQRFTLEQLAQYDGKEGRLAYVAVDGVVYDVSGSQKWPDGRHTSCNLGAMAGQDLSAVMNQAPPSMRALLEQMPVVGTLQ